MQKHIKSILMFLSLLILCSCNCDASAEKNALDWKNLECKGADISYYGELSSLKVQYKKNGNNVELLQLLKDSGVNFIRLRLWVNPQNGWCSTEDTLKTAVLVKKSGFRLLLDFHYSDTFADPGNQKIPEAWKNLSAEEIAEKVYDYTKETLNVFNKASAAPDMVQIGNEINAGILWPYGNYWQDENGNSRENDFTEMFSFLQSGIKAVRETCPEAKIMLHSSRGHSKSDCQWLFGEFEKGSLDYDVIGLSFYSYEMRNNSETPSIVPLSENIKNLKTKFKKDVVVVETYYPWTLEWNDETNNTVGTENQLIEGFPATKEGQKNYLKALRKAVLKSGGKGVFWWEPEAVSANGFSSNLENVSWFDFTNEYTGAGDAFLD